MASPPIETVEEFRKDIVDTDLKRIKSRMPVKFYKSFLKPKLHKNEIDNIKKKGSINLEIMDLEDDTIYHFTFSETQHSRGSSRVEYYLGGSWEAYRRSRDLKVGDIVTFYWVDNRVSVTKVTPKNEDDRVPSSDERASLEKLFALPPKKRWFPASASPDPAPPKAAMSSESTCPSVISARLNNAVDQILLLKKTLAKAATYFAQEMRIKCIKEFKDGQHISWDLEEEERTLARVGSPPDLSVLGNFVLADSEDEADSPPKGDAAGVEASTSETPVAVAASVDNARVEQVGEGAGKRDMLLD